MNMQDHVVTTAEAIELKKLMDQLAKERANRE